MYFAIPYKLSRKINLGLMRKDEEMKILLRPVLITMLFLLLFDVNLRAATQEEQIEELKEQIKEIQKQNQERIEELRRQNQEQIEELQKKIEELEAGREIEQRKIEDLTVKKETEKGDAWLKHFISIGFNPDFTSYFRTRASVFKNATFIGAVPNQKDNILFVDSRLLISPMIKIGENLSIRSQIDVFKNIIWGGLGDASVAQKIFEAPSPSDSFRGALLREVTDTVSGNVLSPVDTDNRFFNIRALYMVAKLPVGVLWVGRQPFDWGLGILNNAGSMPDQDLGSIVDRFEFDTAPLALIDKRLEKVLFAFVVDRLSQGTTISNNQGEGWEYGVGVLYKDSNLEAGGYIFQVFQNNFNLSNGLTADLSSTFQWSLYSRYKKEPFVFSFEFQDLFGKVANLENPLPATIGSNSIDISPKNFLLAGRVEFYPSVRGVSAVVVEGGGANGDNTTTPNKLEGNGIFFNNAYTIDNLLFKHIIPNLYANEGSVTNSWYLRAWSTLKLNEVLYFTPQALFAWVDQRNALSQNVVTPLPEVGRFLGTELEGTLSWKILDHLYLDLIGSVVIAGGGLKDLFSQRAFIEGAVPSIDAARPPAAPFAFEGRFVVTLDSVIKSWTGSSSLLQRGFYEQ
jgi:hypothetical protein